jgi:hypothetical protein
MRVDMRDPPVALAIRSSDFVQSLNHEPLKVRGLAAGRYALKTDGGTTRHRTLHLLKSLDALDELEADLLREDAPPPNPKRGISRWWRSRLAGPWHESCQGCFGGYVQSITYNYAWHDS